ARRPARRPRPFLSPAEARASVSRAMKTAACRFSCGSRRIPSRRKSRKAAASRRRRSFRRILQRRRHRLAELGANLARLRPDRFAAELLPATRHCAGGETNVELELGLGAAKKWRQQETRDVHRSFAAPN